MPLIEEREDSWGEEGSEDAVDGETKAGEGSILVANVHGTRCAQGMGGSSERKPLRYRAAYM